MTFEDFYSQFLAPVLVLGLLVDIIWSAEDGVARSYVGGPFCTLTGRRELKLRPKAVLFRSGCVWYLELCIPSRLYRVTLHDLWLTAGTPSLMREPIINTCTFLVTEFRLHTLQ